MKSFKFKFKFGEQEQINQNSMKIRFLRFRFIKRGEISKAQSAAIRGIALVLSLFAATLFIMILKLNPLEVFSSMLQGAFGSKYRLEETIIKTIPLVVTSLGIAVAFKMKFWNIGAEGQILMGAFLASFVALYMPNLPKPIMLITMMIMGMIGGALWAFLPAFFRAKWGTNETIVTLMMNYIALKWITFLQYGPWKDPKALGFPKIANFADNAILPHVFGVHIGWIIALVLIVIMYFFMNHSKLGYEISVLGESEQTAKYAGINITKTIIIAVMISGALCGLTGMIQVSGVSTTLTDQITGGVGYTAIITTWLASLSAPIILLVSFLFSVLLQGGSYIQTNLGIPQSAAQIIQGIILFFILGSEYFTKYKLIIAKEDV